jgi:hypothetical protein
MKRSFALLALLVAAAPLLGPAPAHAWASANRFGGSTTHSWGDTSHTNAWGGSSDHVAGEGTEHTNAWGGGTAHAWGGGTEHRNAWGGSTYGAYGEGVGHTYAGGGSVYGYGGYPAYHPPVAVPAYAAGCYGCAPAAGAIVGMGAAAAGYAAGVATAVAPAVVGVSYAGLPPGAIAVSRFGVNYYLSGNTWYQPVYGANGVFYQVVPAP